MENESLIFIKFAKKTKSEKFSFGDNAGVLAEIHLSKSRALIGAGKIAEAVLSVADSINVTKTTGNSNELQIAKEFELSIVNKFPVVLKKIYFEKKNKPDDIQLELPPEILPNQDFFGVWIENSGFERIGLKKGTLAIAVKGKVERGDLVAVCDDETDLVTIGFFDKQYGLIGLENYEREPEFIDETNSTIIGKIVGYSQSIPTVNNTYEVKPIILKKK